ncbi:hypothetical protein [Paludisphaera soli]|uniref:hypothetical protein n=1 Tax=Paludisphaera soli TaxID=2712865 RepID=UPI0013EB51CC|nr:hypothetical protein [Paludisphaera soli]
MAIVVLASAPAASRACPNCKEALSAQPGEATRMADGFNWSILVMLGVPAGLLSVGGLAVRRAVRSGVLPEF